jgi:hypothetical protein
MAFHNRLGTNMNHEEVVKRYAAQQVNRRQKRVRWTGDNIYCEGDVIYSYGSHFPMAVCLGDDFFLKNGDKYSVTTSKHQGVVNQFFGVIVRSPAFGKTDATKRFVLATNGTPFTKTRNWSYETNSQRDVSVPS